MESIPRHSREELRDLVEGYFSDVLSGRRLVGKLERKFVQRHFRDLERAVGPDSALLRFSEERAFHVLEFFELNVHTKGQWARRFFRFTRISAWQAALLWVAMGWEMWDPDDLEWRRRFRTVYVSVARKNGKTMLAAILALYFAAFDHEPGAEVYFAATTRDQAKIGWKQAKQCVLRNPDPELRALFEPSADSLAQIAVPDSDSFIKALAANDDNLDGLSGYFVCADELHKHPTGDLVDVLESGMGARREPMLFLITTAGGKREGVCYEYDTTAIRQLDQLITDDQELGFIARLDEGDDWKDPAVWPKANPNLGESALVSKIRAAVRKAGNTPARLNEVRRKHMNCWTESSFAWLPMPAWDACEGIVDLSALKGERCFIGADLSATQDYTAVVAVFPRPDGRYLVKAWFWVPQETLFERERTDKVDVVGWERDGLVTATPGKVIDQDAIKFKLLSLAKEFEVIEIPMDPHNATKLQTELMAHGLPVVNHPQGWISMSPAIKATEILILSEKLVHDGNPVLRWMFGNVALEISSRDNRSFHKGKSTDRIDGQVALAMAIGRSQASEGPSIYESRGLVVIGGDPE